jgi:Ca2+-binding RTX toxin-like protein
MTDITGTTGNDTLPGTGDADNITALAGNDTVNAGAGNDTINGGTGNDTLNGDDGDDTFVEDTITASLDVFNGGNGFDTIELRAAINPIITSLGVLTPHTLSGTTALSSIERLLFASQGGQVVLAILQHSNFAATGITQIVGGAGQDIVSLSLGAAPVTGTYNMLNLPISGFGPISLNAWEHTGDYVVLTGGNGSASSVITLNALTGASYMQLLQGGAGNDILNGSANADILDATRGGDQVNAGAGNDSIIIANTALPSSAPNNFTGAGGVWNGGDGIDVISIGGAVNLQATLQNIEGIHLQPAFFPPVPNTSSQAAAVLTLDSAHIAMLPTDAFVTGIGTIILNIDDGLSFSTANYVVVPGSDITAIVNAGDGDGLIFSAGTEGITINLGRGSQTALGGSGDDVLNNGVSFTPGAGLIAMSGGAGEDILILDNPAEGNLMLDGGTGDDVLQLHSYSSAAPAGSPITHVAGNFGNGSGLTGIETVQFFSVGNVPMTFVTDISTTVATFVGGIGVDQLIFAATSPGTYNMPNFTLLNWNGGDFVGFGVAADATYAVTLNGRNDINQFFFGGTAADTFNGGAMSDRMIGGGGADVFNGNDGGDFLHVTSASTGATFNGGAGVDMLVMEGTPGALAGISGIEVIFFNFNGLTLTGTQFATGLASNAALNGTGTLTVNMDPGQFFISKTFTTSGTVSVVVNGATGTDIFKLGNFAHTINAGDGADQIKGGNAVDTINGGAGVDKINGAGGADILTGGAGNDVFKYANASDSDMGLSDRITDFAIGGDKLNFAKIDTNLALAGDQAFTFVGNALFANTGIAQIRFADEGPNLVVQADINGDGIADMRIILEGLAGQTMTAGDFVL